MRLSPKAHAPRRAVKKAKTHKEAYQVAFNSMGYGIKTTQTEPHALRRAYTCIHPPGTKKGGQRNGKKLEPKT